ncbi:MAG: hypothetical protein OSJ70_00660 [Bacilli bacterium]|nr:hypothetical protein [Bacilli bacterium]
MDTTTKVAKAMTAAQITSVSSALTDCVGGIVDTFVSLVPIIALTAGAIFAIRFVKSRFSKVEHAK